MYDKKTSLRIRDLGKKNYTFNFLRNALTEMLSNTKKFPSAIEYATTRSQQ